MLWKVSDMPITGYRTNWILLSFYLARLPACLP